MTSSASSIKDCCADLQRVMQPCASCTSQSNASHSAGLIQILHSAGGGAVQVPHRQAAGVAQHSLVHVQLQVHLLRGDRARVQGAGPAVVCSSSSSSSSSCCHCLSAFGPSAHLSDAARSAHLSTTGRLKVRRFSGGLTWSNLQLTHSRHTTYMFQCMAVLMSC